MTSAHSEVIGHLRDGSPVQAYTIGGAGGPRLRILDLGATVASLHAFSADSTGAQPNIVLGHRDLSGYTSTPTAYFGATVGRYANRIAHSRFTLHGVTYTLPPNERDTCLHGGPGGFHSRLWTVTHASPDSLGFELVSGDGDQGFPGELTATAMYTVDGSVVRVLLTATTTAPTVVNLTNHTYWNLAGEGSGSTDGHQLTVDAERYLPIDRHSIPLAGPERVTGTAFDLRHGISIGASVRAAHPQSAATRGIDHCYLIDKAGMRRAARLEEPRSGRCLEVYTDQPALQVYTGNYLDGSTLGTSGRRYRQGDGVALETQNLPDAPNRDWAPTPTLAPGQVYASATEWRFSE